MVQPRRTRKRANGVNLLEKRTEVGSHASGKIWQRRFGPTFVAFLWIVPLMVLSGALSTGDVFAEEAAPIEPDRVCAADLMAPSPANPNVAAIGTKLGLLEEKPDTQTPSHDQDEVAQLARVRRAYAHYRSSVLMQDYIATIPSPGAGMVGLSDTGIILNLVSELETDQGRLLVQPSRVALDCPGQDLEALVLAHFLGELHFEFELHLVAATRATTACTDAMPRAAVHAARLVDNLHTRCTSVAEVDESGALAQGLGDSAIEPQATVSEIKALDEEMTGLNRSSFEDEITAQTLPCYQRELARDGKIQGALSVKAEMGNGGLSQIELTVDALAKTSFSDCIVNGLSAAKFCGRIGVTGEVSFVLGFSLGASTPHDVPSAALHFVRGARATAAQGAVRANQSAQPVDPQLTHE